MRVVLLRRALWGFQVDGVGFCGWFLVFKLGFGCAFWMAAVVAGLL